MDILDGDIPIQYPYVLCLIVVFTIAQSSDHFDNRPSMSEELIIPHSRLPACLQIEGYGNSPNAFWDKTPGVTVAADESSISFVGTGSQIAQLRIDGRDTPSLGVDDCEAILEFTFNQFISGSYARILANFHIGVGNAVAGFMSNQQTFFSDYRFSTTAGANGVSSPSVGINTKQILHYRQLGDATDVYLNGTRVWGFSNTKRLTFKPNWSVGGYLAADGSLWGAPTTGNASLRFTLYSLIVRRL